MQVSLPPREFDQYPDYAIGTFPFPDIKGHDMKYTISI